MTNIEDHLDAQTLTYLVFRYIVALAIAAVRENVRLQMFEFTAYRHILGTGLMEREQYSVYGCERFYNLPALVMRHERESFLELKPGIIVEYDHEFVSEFFRLIEHTHMPDMYRIETSRYRHHYLLFIFLFHNL